MNAAAAAEAVTVIGELRAAWPWLAAAAAPSRGARRRPAQLIGVHSLRETKEIRADRDAAALALAAAHPTVPGAHRVDAARPGPLAARADIAGDVRAIAGHLWTARHGTPLRLAVPDPACVRPCPACRAQRRCGCDVEDARLAAALDVIAGELAHAEQRLVDKALRVLQRCARRARQVADVGEDLHVLRVPCPACRARNLAADLSSPRPEEWSVRCRTRTCVCAGDACRCGCPAPQAGRRHLWPVSAGGWHAVAARLGVDLRQLAGPAAA